MTMNGLNNETKKCSLDVINGERRGNQLVLYTNDYGTRTGTNGLGTEVVIENGVVVSKGTNDNIIPENGMVLSGIGLAKDWIDECITVGSNITYHAEKNIIELP